MVIISVIYLKESKFRRPEVKIDFIGAILLAAALFLFVLAISEAETYGWTSFFILFAIFTGAIILIPLLLYEFKYSRKGGEAILNFNLLSIRNVLVANIILAIVGLGMFSYGVLKFKL